MEPTLKRSLSLPLMVLYGLGTTIGAGIYALTGEVSKQAGLATPLSFLVASLMAACTAFSFAELSSRYPRAAGQAIYVREGFGWSRAALVVGLLVALAGSVSAATMANGFAGYLAELLPLPAALAIIAFVVALAALALWGVTESVVAASVVTLVEVGGLLLVVAVAGHVLADLPARADELWASAAPAAWPGILAGGILAFYAFLGFEDMVNVAEEVKDVRRTLPVAIVGVLAATTLLYMLIGLVAVLAAPLDELSRSAAPLALVYERATGRDAAFLSGIGVFAMANGALIQIIMASRILYGLAHQDALPTWLGQVSGRTQTPMRATLLVSGLVLLLALWFPLAPLAEATSVITLVVFALINLALWRIKGANPRPEGAWLVPRWVPLVGCGVCLAFLVIEGVRRTTG